MDLITLALAKAYANSKGVPDAVAADEGKVLTIDNTGTPAWKTPQGGGSEDSIVITFEFGETPPDIVGSVSVADAYAYLLDGRNVIWKFGEGEDLIAGPVLIADYGGYMRTPCCAACSIEEGERGVYVPSTHVFIMADPDDATKWKLVGGL